MGAQVSLLCAEADSGCVQPARMSECGQLAGHSDGDRMSIDEIERLERWLDGDEALSTKEAKRLLERGIKTGGIGRSFHYEHMGIRAQMAGYRAWAKMGFKVVKEAR